MADVIPLLPLPNAPKGRSSYYVSCPGCDTDTHKNSKHLNINLSKDVFRCARCGWNGGMFDLYAFYAGIPREKVRDALKRQLGQSGSTDDSSKNPQAWDTEIYKPSTPDVTSIADIDTRHMVYSALLSMLSLAPDHLINLLARGLSEEQIKKNEYRTTPVVGGKAIARQLLGMGYNRIGIPGFYTDSDGQWTYVSMRRGILIPVRDIQGRIQGLQVRLDNEERRKYRWVSSADIESGNNGCGAEGWIHMCGSIRERIIIVEGPLKADIVHHLTGQTVVAVPGVNSLRHLEHTLTELKELGVRRLMTAFDMDFLKNPHVQNGYGELVELLDRIWFSYGTYLWRPDYNGLDDYIWQYCINK